MGWLVLQKVLVMGIGIFATGWLARELGPEKLGILSNATAIVTYFGILVIGVDAGVFIKKLIDHPEQEGLLLGSTTFVLVVLGLISYALLLIWLWCFSTLGLLEKQVTSAIGFRLCLAFPAPIGYWFRSKLKLQYSAMAQTLATLFYRSWQVLVQMMGLGLLRIAIGEPVSLIFQALVNYAFYRSCGQRFQHWKVKWQVGYEVLLTSLPALVAGILLTLMSRLDLLMITYFHGHEQAGYYSAATTLTESSYFFTTLISFTITPVLVKKFKDQPSEYWGLRKDFARFCGLAGWLSAMGLCWASALIIRMVYGENFDASINVLAIQAFMLIAAFIGAALQTFLTTESQLKWLAAFLAFGLVFNAGLNYLLIPIYGIEGAAVASLIAITSAYTWVPFLFSATRQHAKLLLGALVWPFPNVRRFRSV